MHISIDVYESDALRATAKFLQELANLQAAKELPLGGYAAMTQTVGGGGSGGGGGIYRDPAYDVDLKKHLAEVAERIAAEEATVEEVESPKQKKAKPTKGETAAPAASYTIEQVRAAVAEKLQGGKRVETIELLTSLGATKVSDLAPQQYGKLMDQLEKI
jgi:hypothetical protein